MFPFEGNIDWEYRYKLEKYKDLQSFLTVKPKKKKKSNTNGVACGV